MKRYQVTLSAEIGVTADDEDEAIRRCDEDAREFVAQNDDLDVEDVEEVSAATHELTESLDDIQYQSSETVEEADEDSVDWTMKGIYSVVVDAENQAQAIELAKALPARLAREEMLARYAVTLTAEINITADNAADAIRRCDEDAREFVVQNETLKVKAIEQVDPDDQDLTESLDEIEFHSSEVVRKPKKGWVDWTMNGVYTVVVDAVSPAEAEEIAKALPKKLGEEAVAAPSM